MEAQTEQMTPGQPQWADDLADPELYLGPNLVVTNSLALASFLGLLAILFYALIA